MSVPQLPRIFVNGLFRTREEHMEALPRSALQALAQKAGVAANQKTAAILAALHAVQACEYHL